MAVQRHSISGNPHEKIVTAVAFEAGDQSASLEARNALSTSCGRIF